MGVLLGSCCVSQSLPPSSVSSSSSHSQRRDALKRRKKKKIVPMASLHHENPNDMNFLKRRAFLLMGLSAFPVLQPRARALEDFAVKEKRDRSMPEVDGPQNLQGISSGLQDQTEQVQAPVNPFVGLLNELGLFGLGVLGALYALTWKEKTELESTIESMKTQLSEKADAMALLEKNFESRLQNEREDKLKQIGKAKEEQASLLDQLSSANAALMVVRQELHREKKLAQEFKLQIDQLESNITQADEKRKILEAKLQEKQDTVDVLQDRVSLLSLEIKDKEMSIENLTSLLAEKESECKSLISICEQTKANLEEANSAAEGLKAELLKTREELDLKISSMEDLNVRIKSLLAERDKLNKKVQSLQEEYSNLKSSSEKQAASDSKLLSDKDRELNLLEEKLGVALSEASSNQEVITDLTKERDHLSTRLEKETSTVKNLRGELQLTQEALGVSRLEATNLSKQLKQSKQSCEELALDVSRLQAELAETQNLLSQSLDEAKFTSKALSDELISVKEVLLKTKQELVAVTGELKDAAAAHESLKKELLEIYKKAEIATHDLGEERKAVTSLKKDLEASKKQIATDKEARMNLETDLEDATKSLDEMNKNTLLLSRELEIVNSRTASLESEKNMLYKSLIEQKDATKEAKENLEDAQDILTRLSKERENLEKRGKRLEEELAAAKGEILRLRREMNSTRSRPVSEPTQPKGREAEVGTPVTVKRNGRRRKAGPTSDATK
ncbi:MAR-binding filament-like protein 1-1 [Magnolia sinica]|uniref:MAR-binding filament-like protein 1-1 n=1 Tax=Magnolia sinica TaxID=86752 RepID=UPI00265AF23D|nr:MAR-binding filament-like protein 1-1 [Magnolia sinica]